MNRRRGVTLIEMLIVVAIAAMIAGISLPTFGAGLDSLRLAQAADSVSSFLSGAMNRAQRRQQVIEVTVAPHENQIVLRSTEPGFSRTLHFPQGIRITGVVPARPTEANEPRHFLLLPGSTIPRLGVELSTTRGNKRVISIDPITGAPEITRP